MAKTGAPLTALIEPIARDLERLDARARDQARRGGQPAVVSFTVAAEEVDPLAIFDGAAIVTGERALWLAPGDRMALVALGAAAVLVVAGTPSPDGGPDAPATADPIPEVSAVSPGASGRAGGEGAPPVSRRRAAVAVPGPIAGQGPGDEPAGPLAGVAGALESAWQTLCAGALVDAPHGVWGAGPVLVGGFAFDPAVPPAPAWAGFPAARFVLPELMVTRGPGGTWLTFNRVVVPGTPGDPPGDAAWTFPGGVRLTVPRAAGCSAGERGRRWLSLLAIADRAAPGRPHGGGPRRVDPGGGGRRRAPGPIEAVALPGRRGWMDAVAAALEAIAAGELAKVVLARRLRVRAGAAFDPGTVLRRLRAEYPECFVFAVAGDCSAPGGRSVFLGATPERLVRLREGRLETAALAGSTARGATVAEDDELARALLGSPKEREEHALVVRMLRETLAPVCRVLQLPPEPRLLRLRNVQHLYTPVSGMVDQVTVPQLVARLHPTPALGGWPRDRALAFIRRWEGGARGWYGGPVGWFDHRGEGEMAVAIRSGLLRGAEAWLFAGCGVVAGSDPEREWRETALKLRPLAAALGVAPEPGDEAGAGEAGHGG
ncbi:MAG TPA: isochorismate synthase [Thermaerobacter sp.]